MTKEKLKEKYKVFESLLNTKKKRFEEISNFQQEHVESINEADLDNNSIAENQTEMMLREARVENESLDHLKEEINYLEDYQSFGNQESVGHSTIVKTSFANLVVSVPSKPFKVGGEEYYGISTKSPIYEALEGKSAGETVKFNGQEITINEVI